MISRQPRAQRHLSALLMAALLAHAFQPARGHADEPPALAHFSIDLVTGPI